MFDKMKLSCDMPDIEQCVKQMEPTELLKKIRDTTEKQISEWSYVEKIPGLYTTLSPMNIMGSLTPGYRNHIARKYFSLKLEPAVETVRGGGGGGGGEPTTPPS